VINQIRGTLISAVSAAGLTLLDQAIKCGIRTLPEGSVLLHIPLLVEITHYTNTGAAFSILSGHTMLLTVLSLVLLAGVLIFVRSAFCLSPWAKGCLVCMLAGGFGNLIDRVMLGGVTDYIRLLFIDFPVFNLADILITGSVFMLMLLLLAGRLETTEDSSGGNYHGSDH